MEKRKPDYFQIFLVVAVLALAVLVVLLAVQNRELKAELAAQHHDLPPDALAAGDRLDPLPLVDEAGESLALDLSSGSSSTLLLFFSSTCPACEETLPVWSELLPAYRAAPGIRLIGIQTDLHVAQQGDSPLLTAALPFPVHGPAPGPGAEQLRRIPFIPAAVLVDPGGTVQGAWYGVPSEEALEELRSGLDARSGN